MNNLHELASIVEYGEARAAIDFIQAVPADFASQIGLRVQQFDSTVVLTAKSIPLILYNRVICAGLVEPITKALVEEIANYLHQYASRKFAFQISPAVQTPEIPAWLEEAGLRKTNAWMKAYRGTEPPLPVRTEFRVEAIDGAYTAAFADVCCKSFDVPEMFSPMFSSIVGRDGWQCYIAFDRETPVAVAALFTQEGIAWFGLAGTLYEYRRRGAQSALIARRIQDAIACGCQWMVVETDSHTPEKPNRSYLNLMKAGFQLAYTRPNYEFLRASS